MIFVGTVTLSNKADPERFFTKEGGMTDGAKLANQFDIANAVRFDEGPGGLIRAVVSTPAVEAEVYLQGAHVAHWAPSGQRPVLFLSRKSLFAPGKAIRGGVPVIFPWFGARGDGKPGPAHGFARNTQWVIGGTRLRNDGRVEITLALAPNDVSRGFGYSAFHLGFRVTVGSELECWFLAPTARASAPE